MSVKAQDEIHLTVCAGVGQISLNRPRALNALSLHMVRTLMQALLDWADDPQIHAVTLRGMSANGPFGVLCAGGDIRFLHQAAMTGDPRLEDFFSEEYALNYLIHRYPKPYIAFMDGVVMGGGMGISQGAGLRLVTERSKLAMPETAIGLFPDVGGGFFLGRVPGHIGTYLALTGEAICGAQAVALGLADLQVDSASLAAIWDDLAAWRWANVQELKQYLAQRYPLSQSAATTDNVVDLDRAQIERYFNTTDIKRLMADLEASSTPWAARVAALLRRRSPLMLHVVLELLRRARGLDLAEELRLERSLVRHCFGLRLGAESETVEGIRALVIDKDHAPHWQPARIEDVDPDLVAAYFEPAWPSNSHPLRNLERDFESVAVFRRDQALIGQAHA